MTLRIAISGHRGLSPAIERLVETALRTALSEVDDPVVGISCIADGADQIFARAVLDAGGGLEVVVPAEKYRDGLPVECHPAYDAMLAQAVRVHSLPFVESTSESHMEASKRMVDDADELWAVWDGLPARSYGGTADVVGYAQDQGIRVRVFWPDGASRD